MFKILFLCALSLPTFADSGDLFGELFGRQKRPGPRISYGVQQFETKGQRQGPHELALRHHELSASTPLTKLSDRQWKLSVDSQLDETKTRAKFQNGDSVPRQLWEASTTLSHLRKLESDRTILASLTIGSKGDKLFHQFTDTQFTSNLIYQIPGENESGWLYTLNFSNSRTFLNYVPLPGFAYYFRPAESLRLVLGVPFLALFWNPFEKAVFSLSYFPINSLQTKFSYFLFGPAHFYLQGKFESAHYLLNERASSKDRLFRENINTSAGFSMPLEQNIFVDASVGYDFERRYYLGQKHSDRNGTNRLDFQNAPYASLKFTGAF